MSKNKYENGPKNNSPSPTPTLSSPPLRQPQTAPANLEKKEPEISPTPDRIRRVQPEEMSLKAHAHIQAYLTSSGKTYLEKEDLNAVLRLFQHLRIFGLVSAVGYLNQSNAQENNETRKRTVPVWSSLLGQMLEVQASNVQERRQLMEKVLQKAKQEPAAYMGDWRKSMILAEQWNFWARAYAKGE